MFILRTVNNDYTMEEVFYQGDRPKKMDVRKAVAHACANDLMLQFYIVPTGEILEWRYIREVQGATKHINHVFQWFIHNISPVAKNI